MMKKNGFKVLWVISLLKKSLFLKHHFRYFRTQSSSISFTEYQSKRFTAPQITTIPMAQKRVAYSQQEGQGGTMVFPQLGRRHSQAAPIVTGWFSCCLLPGACSCVSAPIVKRACRLRIPPRDGQCCGSTQMVPPAFHEFKTQHVVGMPHV